MTYNQDLFQQFLTNAVTVIQFDSTVIGLAAGGLWATPEMAGHFDIDLVVVTQFKITIAAEKIEYAHRLGDLLSAFTGEHGGGTRLADLPVQRLVIIELRRSDITRKGAWQHPP